MESKCTVRGTSMLAQASHISLQTPISVWEDSCRACDGTGQSRLRRRGRSRQPTCLGVCVACQGIGAHVLILLVTSNALAHLAPATDTGVLRRASVRITPEAQPNSHNGRYLTVGRAGLAGSAGQGSAGDPAAPARPSKSSRLPSLGQLKARAAAQRKAAGRDSNADKTKGQEPSSSSSYNGAATLGARNHDHGAASPSAHHQPEQQQLPGRFTTPPDMQSVSGTRTPSPTGIVVPPNARAADKDPVLR